jgi:pimeloyl-ACP methyl ester carboxylesterase/DNA-binding CsgD family transcriptional regulator/class 3 adenylate cyclase
MEPMLLPTGYAKSGDVNIAYQVLGSGPVDLVFVMGWVSHLDAFWEEPRVARFLQRLAGFSRLILLDKRGTGLSDPVPLHALPTLEQRMDDVRAVMDAVGSQRAAVLGVSEAGALCTLFAATYPERVAALILIGCYARRLWAPDHPWGYTPDDVAARLAEIERDWGGPVGLEKRAPSAANDPAFREWWAKYLRMSASRGAAVAFSRMAYATDVRSVLPAIHVPTLIIHRTDETLVPVAEARFLARQIPGARLIELPGIDHLPFVGDQEAILAEIEQLLTGARPAPEPDRVLATMLVAEIAGGSEAAVRLGDRGWGEAQQAFREAARTAVTRHHGRQGASPRGGCLAAFDGPGRAVRCAEEIVTGARRLRLRARAGLHAGEVAVVDEEIAGVAVELAARVAAQAAPGQVLVSNTVKDLVVGSGLDFQPLGDRVFPGLPGEWRLFSLASGLASPVSAARLPAPHDEGRARRPASVLSAREREVARLLALGLSNRRIADELAISLGTVERHVANIFAKLGYGSRAQVAAWAVEQGLLNAPSL